MSDVRMRELEAAVARGEYGAADRLHAHMRRAGMSEFQIALAYARAEHAGHGCRPVHPIRWTDNSPLPDPTPSYFAFLRASLAWQRHRDGPEYFEGGLYRRPNGCGCRHYPFRASVAPCAEGRRLLEWLSAERAGLEVSIAAGADRRLLSMANEVLTRERENRDPTMRWPWSPPGCECEVGRGTGTVGWVRLFPPWWVPDRSPVHVPCVCGRGRVDPPFGLRVTLRCPECAQPDLALWHSSSCSRYSRAEVEAAVPARATPPREFPG